MKKYMNVLCVLILALILVDLLVSLFVPVRRTVPGYDFSAYYLPELAGMLAVVLVALASVAAAFVYFIRFILNVNRNQVFTANNIALLRKYGACALLLGVCLLILSIVVDHDFGRTVSGCADVFVEGLFALLMGEVFGIGLKLRQKNA